MTSLGDVPTKRPKLHLSGDPAADKLLADDPFALLVGMVLDQHIQTRIYSAGAKVRLLCHFHGS